MLKSIIRGTGSYLPEKILTNQDLEKMVDTTDEWITQRSGIKQRHIAAVHETTSDMAVKAARRALQNAGVGADDIDGIVVATTTPDRTFPSVAVTVQAALGIAPCPALDVQAVCTGFIYALSVADGFIQTRQSRRVLVIGAEKMSAIIDWEDRSTCVLFADGAGAVILEASEQEEGRGVSGRGLHSTHLYANGAQRDMLYTDGGPASTGKAGHIVMQGREVFKYAVQYMADAVNEALNAHDLTSADIDYLVPHQANIRIIEATAKKLGLSMNRVITTVQKHGNTSAASIPLALDDAVRAGTIKKGDLLLLEAMGAGFTWGSALLRF